MRRFEIADGSKRSARACAVISWERGFDDLQIELCEWAGPNDLPMILAALCERGERTVRGEWARRWVEERVVPPGRQNLGEVLRANGLEYYDELELLVAAEGRCAQDDFCIREVGCGESASAGSFARQVAEEHAAARKAAGLTQAELAKRAGLKQSAVSRLESGSSNPTLAMIGAVAKALGKDPHISFS